MTDAETINLLRSIDRKLGQLDGDFESLSDEDKRLYMAAAIKNASLEEIATHPAQLQYEQVQREREEAEAVERALMTTAAEDIELARLRYEIGPANIGKALARRGFDKSRLQ